MKLPALPAIAAALLAGCGRAPEDSASPTAAPAEAGGWDLRSSGEGVTLALASGGGAALRLSCPAGRRQLTVTVAAFEPIASEERLSIGSGGDAHALVADSRGDGKRGGVTASGPVPANLAALLAGPVSASYGAQASGPHEAPPADLAAAFVAACSAASASPAPARPAPAAACLTQDGRPIAANQLRAIGTEPFWGARIEGRCVTYSHPEDQAGTRVWTRFEGSATDGSWSGALGGSPFVLRTRAAPGCSDGMSDNLYPIAVTLAVGGEQRTGCAEPLPAGRPSE